MVICRLRLAPRYSLSLSLSPPPPTRSHVIITQRFSSRACLGVPIPLHPPSSSPTPTHAFERDASPTDRVQISGDHISKSLSSTQSTNEPLFTDSSQDDEKKKDDTGPSPTFRVLYGHLNAPEFSKLATELSGKQVHAIALRARKKRHAFVLDNLSRNVLDSPQVVRAELATTLLSVPRLRLDPQVAAALLSCISPDHLSSLSLDTLSHIACSLTHPPSPSDTETPLTRLAEYIARRLKPPWRRRDHRLQPSSEPTIPIWPLFELVVHLTKCHLREPALRIVQSLVEAAYIPPEAVQRTDQFSGDFHMIILLTLVRSCIFWKWNHKALSLLRTYLGRNPPVGPIINRLYQDILYALTEFPTVEDLDLGVSFIEDMVSYQEPIFISPGIVRQIYSSAQSLGQPQIAARLYMTAQSESLHNFPLPSGTALTWFLRYLSNEPAYSHHARRLVKEVADRCEPIPLTDRAEFITLAAESGFASSARLLWERYSSGRGGQSVAGNAAMVVRMCSLFANLRRGKSADKSKTSGLGIKRIASPVVSAPDDDSKGLLPLSPEDEKDFGSFAKLVLTRYRETKEPLRQASREDLNALARANVILGDVMEALGVLRVITDRYECPDLHDINVTLSALDPRLALKMVRRMVDVGPKPDGISFGTVIHQAARRGDLGVIIGLLRLMRETGQQPTTKTVVTVIRASVALSGTDKEAIRDNLVRALEVIMANAHSNHLATLDMGRFCVDEALRADDAALAFGFWEQVVRPRAEWDDDAHASLRRRIAGSIRRQCEEGHIRGKDGRRMRYALSRRRREEAG